MTAILVIAIGGTKLIMKTWYSICWSPRNFNNPNSFIELDGCPRFYLSEDGAPPCKCIFEVDYPNLYVKEIFKTQIFVKNEDDRNMPTHYRHGVFVPGQNLAYDAWLEKSFGVNEHILEKVKAREELYQKKVFLEYSNKIIRHDMHSGINTYIPRGLSMLKKRLSEEKIKELQLTGALTLLERGLAHTQMVYQGVYAFTNLVKEDSVLETSVVDLKTSLDRYLKHTAYYQSVDIENLESASVNESLFCTAVDNFIRNGLKYNESDSKKVKVYKENNFIVVEDNGVGMTQNEFEELSLPFRRKHNLQDGGSGLGLNIALAILKEHQCSVKILTSDNGTKLAISGLFGGLHD